MKTLTQTSDPGKRRRCFHGIRLGRACKMLANRLHRTLRRANTALNAYCLIDNRFAILNRYCFYAACANAFPASHTAFCINQKHDRPLICGKQAYRSAATVRSTSVRARIAARGYRRCRL